MTTTRKNPNKAKLDPEKDEQVEKLKVLAEKADVQDVGYNASKQKQKRDDDRWHLSKWIVAWYIAFTALILIGIPIYNLIVYIFRFYDAKLDLVDILGQFNAVFGVPLGFVIGHYFKEK